MTRRNSHCCMTSILVFKTTQIESRVFKVGRDGSIVQQNVKKTRKNTHKSNKKYSHRDVCIELHISDNFYFHLREYCISTTKLMHTKIVNGSAHYPFRARSSIILFLVWIHTTHTHTQKLYSSIYTLVHGYELICKIIETKQVKRKLCNDEINVCIMWRKKIWMWKKKRERY